LLKVENGQKSSQSRHEKATSDNPNTYNQNSKVCESSRTWVIARYPGKEGKGQNTNGKLFFNLQNLFTFFFFAVLGFELRAYTS
jgi:hypothetical protein